MMIPFGVLADLLQVVRPESRGTVSILLALALFAAAAAGALASGRMPVFDFGRKDAAREWAPVNDTVMGGVSSSRLRPTVDGTVVFEGVVSLENNGGFASVRSLPRQRDLSGHSGLALRVRGDGNRYKLNLKNDANLDGVLYRAVFDTVRDQWQTVHLRFEEFVPTFRGRGVPGAEPLDPADIVSFGLMISDNQAGPFRLEIARIEAFTD